MEWISIFAGLETRRYDLIVSFLGRNAEREKKYLYSDVPYNWNVSSIAFAKGRTDIKKLEDLIGKTVTGGLIAKEQGLDVEFLLRNDVPVTAQYWLFTRGVHVGDHPQRDARGRRRTA